MQEMVKQPGSYVRPHVMIKENNTITKDCRICGKSILYKKQYHYISPVAEVKLTICRDCGVREYYGAAGKGNKTYKKHMIDKTLFGLENND